MNWGVWKSTLGRGVRWGGQNLREQEWQWDGRRWGADQ